MLNVSLYFYKGDISIEGLFETLKHSIYYTLEDIPFKKWDEMAKGDISALNKTNFFIIDDVLSVARLKLYEQYINDFGMSTDEISRLSRECEVTKLESKYYDTNKYMHKQRAIDLQKLIDFERDNTKGVNIGNVADQMFKKTGKTYNLNTMSAFEVFTILNSK